MRKVLLTTLSLVASVAAWAITITPTAGGQVSTLATNVNETSLTINGVIDARDFVYIGEKLTKLTTLNLQRATIAAYESEKPLFGNQYSYSANVVPAMSLASHPTLKNISFPASATTIGTGALAGCNALTSVTIPVSVTNIEAFAFAGCSALSSITLPPSVARLGNGAFTRCTALANVQLGTSGTATALNIGDEAFLGCTALSTFKFNNRMTSIGKRAFAGTKIKALDLSSYTSLTSIGDYAFALAPLTSVKYPSSVSAIGTGALLYSSATDVSLPKNLQQVPAFAFAGAAGLQEIALANTKIDTIGAYAFYKVNKPTQITLPATTSHIGTMAMAGMTGLQSISSNATTVPSLDDDVWQGLNQPAINLYVPQQALQDYSTADQWKEFNVLLNYVKGDINCDGMIDVSDINIAINIMLKIDISEYYVFEAGDMDDNNVIDVEDVNAIINIILKSSIHAPVAPNTSDAITIDDLSINAGEQRAIELKLDNASLYNALQCDIILPDGLHIVDAHTTGNAMRHTVVTGSINGGVRVLCYSNEAKAMTKSADATPVVVLNVKADANLAEQSTISIINSTLATAECRTMHCPATTAWVSSTTGVNDIDASKVKVWANGSTLFIEAGEPAVAQLTTASGISTSLAVMGGLNEYADIAPGIYIVRVANTSYKVVIRD